MKKQLFNKELDKKLNMSFSDDDSDKDLDGEFRKNIGKIDEKEEEEDKRMLEQIARMNLLEIVEQNEK